MDEVYSGYIGTALGRGVVRTNSIARSLGVAVRRRIFTPGNINVGIERELRGIWHIVAAWRFTLCVSVVLLVGFFMDVVFFGCFVYMTLGGRSLHMFV